MKYSLTKIKSIIIANIIWIWSIRYNILNQARINQIGGEFVLMYFLLTQTSKFIIYLKKPNKGYNIQPFNITCIGTFNISINIGNILLGVNDDKSDIANICYCGGGQQYQQVSLKSQITFYLKLKDRNKIDETIGKTKNWGIWGNPKLRIKHLNRFYHGRTGRYEFIPY